MFYCGNVQLFLTGLSLYHRFANGKITCILFLTSNIAYDVIVIQLIFTF